MSEPISMSVGALIWEFVLKPIADSIKKEYGDETKKLLRDSLNKAWNKLPFSPKEKEIIEVEIIEADSEILKNRDKFIEYITNNPKIPNDIKQNSYTNYGTIKVTNIKNIDNKGGTINFN